MSVNLDDLYTDLQGLSKALEGSGRIDEHDHPQAYAVILDTMTVVRKLQAQGSTLQHQGDQVMTTLDKVEGISVFVKIDGQFCVAPIAADSGEAFVGMLSAFQLGSPKQTRLIRLPDTVTMHVKASGEALYDAARKESK